MTIRVLTVIDAVGSLPRFTDRIEPLPTAVQTLSILYKAVLLKAKRTSNNELPPGENFSIIFWNYGLCDNRTKHLFKRERRGVWKRMFIDFFFIVMKLSVGMGSLSFGRKKKLFEAILHILILNSWNLHSTIHIR